MIERRTTRQVIVGGVTVGGDAPVRVQSMCDTDTRDVGQTVDQIHKLEEAGCELIRVAVPDKKAVQSPGHYQEPHKYSAYRRYTFRLSASA